MLKTDDALRIFGDYQKYLLLGSDYPLSILYSNRNLLKTIAEDEERQPNVSLCGEGCRTAIIDDVVVGLDGIGDMFRGLLKDVEDAERDITLGLSDSDPLFQITIPKHLWDQPNNHEVGFCFADIASNGFLGLKDVMLRALVDHPTFRNRCFIKTSPTEVIPNPSGCYEFLQQCAALELLLFSLVHTSSGGPGRGTEVVAQCLRNSQGGDIRNVQVLLGQLCFVGGYNKTSYQVSALSSSTHLRSTLADGTVRLRSRRSFTAFHPGRSSRTFCVRGWCTVLPRSLSLARSVWTIWWNAFPARSSQACTDPLPQTTSPTP